MPPPGGQAPGAPYEEDPPCHQAAIENPGAATAERAISIGAREEPHVVSPRAPGPKQQSS